MTNILSNNKNLKLFIRDVLGCGCPEKIFEKMICRREPLGRVAGTSIDVGGRLLVFLTDLESAKDTVDKLGSLLKAGKEKRDECGFNRVRLVVSMDAADSLTDDLQRRFEELRMEDEKVHLHVLHPTAIPAFLTGKKL